MVKIEGRVVIEARDSLTGELKDYRDINNLVYDVYRMRYFFPWRGASSTNIYPLIQFSGTYMYLYLSEYSGTIDQSSYSSMTRYATSSSYLTPTTTVIQPARELLKTYPVVSVSGQSPTRTLRCAGLLYYYSGVESFYISAVAVDPPITHDSVTTLYVHYYLRLYLDSNDPLFGNEVLQRSGGVSYQIGIPGYKKQFYIAPIAVKALESADIPDTPRLFRYDDDSLYYSKKGSISIPQSWCGPVGGVYEMRNSSLGAGCMYDPHISRIFAHKSSEVHSIFYDSTETDIPESEGTLVLDISSHTLELPEVYQTNFVTTGDVGTATYNVREYMCPTGNELYYSGACFDRRGMSGDRTYGKNIYISGNREWRTSKSASTTTGASEISQSASAYICVGYKQFDRTFSNCYTDQYCIRNDGLLYHTMAGTSTTNVTIVSSGSVTLVTQSGLPIVVGNRCRFRKDTSGENVWMEGVVASYIGTSLTITVDSSAGSDTGDRWWINRCSTVIKSADMNSTNVNPTENTEFDVATVLPGLGITQILGLCIDEDEGYLWIATNAGFARASILTEYSGGAKGLPYVTPYDFTFFDHNTIGFGSYMSSVNNVVIYDPWNGRFTAENGTLTWTQKNSPRTVWHWTGDRDARSVTVSDYNVSNLFLQLDMNYIVVVRNSYSTEDYCVGYLGVCYVSVLRIGDSTEGLVVTYNYNTDINHYTDYSGYTCGVGGKQFWYLNVSYSSGNNRRGRIDLTTMTHTLVNNGTSYRPGNSLGTHMTIHCSSSANRSIHPNFATYAVTSAYDNPTQSLILDSGPCYWGWDGSNWVIDTDYSHVKTTHGTSEALPNNVMIEFHNATGAINSFRSGDYYTFGINPKGLYKDNLQTITLYISMYGYHSNVVTRTIIVPSGSVYTIPEASTYPNFISLAYWRYDPHAKVTFADTTIGTIVNATPTSTYEVQFNYNGTLTFYTGHVGESVEIRYVWLTKGLE